MKYLAILGDSLREALDAKVIYVLMALSGLVILVVASISFRPRPAEEGLKDILERLPGAGAGDLTYQFEHLEQTNAPARAWQGEYRFDLVVSAARGQGPDGKRPLDKGFLFRARVWASGLKIEDRDRLSAEDREARRRLLLLWQQARDLPPGQLEGFFTEHMREEARRVTPGQMERFIRDELASRGTLEPTDVRLEADKGDEFRFTVAARARPETIRTWPHTVILFFGMLPLDFEMPVGPLVYMIEDSLVGSFGAGVAMLVSTVITAFFIPNMLRKGAIDLLLAKPLHRWALLVYKFIGGLTFMFLNTVLIVVGIWLVLGLRSGLWPSGFLLSIFILTYEFAIFYAVSTLFGVLTRSPIVAILMACLTWAVLWLVGNGFVLVDVTRQAKQFPNWVYVTADTVHFVLPRYKDLDALNGRLMAHDLLGPDSPEHKAINKAYSSINWGESLGFTTGWIAVLVGLACWRFAVKDY